jgi:superfamily II DNA or RNA helicase
MVCAAGKTVMALYIASTLGKKTLVIVHKEFLMSQWRERIEQFLPGASVGKVQGSVFDVEGRDVVLCMLQSLALRDYDMGAAGFGTVIVDECHHTSAEVFSRALHSVNFDHSLGLSATIKRKDGLGHVFQWFLGPVVFKSKRAKETGVSVDVWEYEGPDAAYREECWIYGKQLNTARMISNVCGYQPRTEFVARLAMDARAAGRTTLILSERRAHLVDLEKFITRMFHEAGAAPSVGYYVGGLKQEELKRSESCSVLLGTYAMAAEGMDIPSLNTLVMASPKTDIEQSVGRILRVKADARTVTPLVIDVVDPFSIFATQACKRASYYRKCGYEVAKRRYPPATPQPDREGGTAALESFAFVDQGRL